MRRGKDDINPRIYQGRHRVPQEEGGESLCQD